MVANVPISGATRHVAGYLAAMLPWVLQACHCAPAIPDVSENDDDDEPHSDSPDPADDDSAGPRSRCPNPEVEPNNGLDVANDLPLEVRACADFSERNDFDFWTYTLEVGGWTSVRIYAQSEGSDADVALLLQSDQDDYVDLRLGWHTLDPTLNFPAVAGDYTVLITETQNRGDAEGHYFYDMMATSVKSPVSFDRSEMEPNEGRSEALVVADGDRVWGDFAASLDNDYYKLVVPPGKHEITLDIDAVEVGSAANTTLFLEDGAGHFIEEFDWGETPDEPDSLARFSSAGDEVLFVNVREESTPNGRGGRAYWYVLSIAVEDAP